MTPLLWPRPGRRQASAAEATAAHGNWALCVDDIKTGGVWRCAFFHAAREEDVSFASCSVVGPHTTTICSR